MRSLRLFSILLCLSIFIIITIPIQFFLNIFQLKWKSIYPLFFYKVIKNIVGIKINTEGLEENEREKAEKEPEADKHDVSRSRYCFRSTLEEPSCQFRLYS